MCRFISIVVAGNADVEGLEAWARSCGLSIEPIVEPSRRAGNRLVFGTCSACDCHVPLGDRSGARRGRHGDVEARELRARGWSESKVQRSLAQKAEASRRKDEKKTAQAEGSLEEWATFLRGAAVHGKVALVGIAYRTDGVRVEGKHLPAMKREGAPASSVDVGVLARLAENVLYEFSPTS